MSAPQQAASSDGPKGSDEVQRISADSLAGHTFLRGFSPAHLEILAQNAMTVRFAAGDTIFEEGDPANRFYLIQEGSVALEARRGGGNLMRIQTIGAGDVLGWSWLFPPYFWHFSARALESTCAIFFYGTRLREQCEADHSLGFALMKRVAAVVIQRLQATRRSLLKEAARSAPRPSGESST